MCGEGTSLCCTSGGRGVPLRLLLLHLRFTSRCPRRPPLRALIVLAASYRTLRSWLVSCRG